MDTHQQQSGFTLVEMIVSLAIFAIVVTVAVGALLVLVGTNERLQTEQAVMANLSFALDSMTREIRTGNRYYCFYSTQSNALIEGGSLDETLRDTASDEERSRDCATGSANQSYVGLSFIEGGDSITEGDSRILYYYDATTKTVYRRTDSSAAQPIIGPGSAGNAALVNIADFEFFVTGTEDLNTGSGDSTADTTQPTVTIYIKASENSDGSGKQFEVQTTVTQRTLDV